MNYDQRLVWELLKSRRLHDLSHPYYDHVGLSGPLVERGEEPLVAHPLVIRIGGLLQTQTRPLTGHPGIHESRLDHSLATADLMRRAGRAMWPSFNATYPGVYPDRERFVRTLRVSAITHDIAHLAASHGWEKAVPGYDHEASAGVLIRGPLRDCLRACGVDTDQVALLVTGDPGRAKDDFPHYTALCELCALLLGAPGMDSLQWVTANAMGYLGGGHDLELVARAMALYRHMVRLAESVRVVEGKVAYAEQLTGALAQLFRTRNVLNVDLTWSPRAAAVEELLLYLLRPHILAFDRQIHWDGDNDRLITDLAAITDFALIERTAATSGFVGSDGNPDGPGFVQAAQNRIARLDVVVADHVTNALPHRVDGLSLEGYFNYQVRQAVRGQIPSDAISITANSGSPVPGGFHTLHLYRETPLHGLHLVETPRELAELARMLNGMCSRVSVLTATPYQRFGPVINRVVLDVLTGLGGVPTQQLSPFGFDRSTVSKPNARFSGVGT